MILERAKHFIKRKSFDRLFVCLLLLWSLSRHESSQFTLSFLHTFFGTCHNLERHFTTKKIFDWSSFLRLFHTKTYRSTSSILEHSVETSSIIFKNSRFFSISPTIFTELSIDSFPSTIWNILFFFQK